MKHEPPVVPIPTKTDQIYDVVTNVIITVLFLWTMLVIWMLACPDGFHDAVMSVCEML